MENKELRLGLDLGTNSVGWALLNEKNQLVKKNGFTFWGVRMFDEANTAAERRGYRTARRRLNRRKYRLDLLKEIFTEPLNAIDPTFFQRLEDSFYKIEDKTNPNYYNLFTDHYTDQEYFRLYPTIYHLRAHLIHATEQEDIRLIYLAIHHIMKYRGNFLLSGDEFKISDFSQIKDAFSTLRETINELKYSFEEEEDFKEQYFDVPQEELDESFFNELQRILELKDLKERKNQLRLLWKVDKKSIISEAIIPLLAGAEKIDMAALSVVKGRKYEKCEISLLNEDLDGAIDNCKACIPELSPLSAYFLELKKVVDYFYISKILKDPNTTYSEAMVKRYEDHQKDLKRLKKFIKKYASEKYSDLFRKTQKHNYPNYVGFNSIEGKPITRGSHCTRLEFYAYLKEKILEGITVEEAQEEKNYFITKMENNELLLRQNSNQNGAFPMQLHLTELKMILDRQKKYYPFLNKKKDGLTNEEKIIALFKFKIPYYVGPLDPNSPYSWLCKKSNEKITPWNFNQVVDLDETAGRFIKRMQNKCTYLKGPEDYCLPKKSIIFSEFNCLSYLNKINLNGKVIPIDIKQELFNQIFLKKKDPTKKNIIDYLKANYGEQSVSSSVAKELPDVNCNMASYIKFKEIFGDDLKENMDMVENIIRDITIFEDKNILEQRLRLKYGLSEDRIKKIKDLNYNGYSRLSKNLLVSLPVSNAETGEVIGSVLEVMRQTNMNLQEILYKEEYQFTKTIDAYNEPFIHSSDGVASILDEQPFLSPGFKRPVIQAFAIIDEIEEIFKRKIDKFYIECSRTNKAKKQVTTSRYHKIKDLYKACQNLAADYNINLKALNHTLDNHKDQLKSDLIYLYFTQLGLSLYTLEPIDIDDLSKNNSRYDIDHIYPQALIKDDSLSNRVLTEKGKNEDKKSHFLFELPGFLPKKANLFYHKLLELDLISKEKYKRLTEKELTSELDGFVNRQLVSTNQAVKALAESLKIYKGIGSANIIYSKAENISDFRNDFHLVKSRLANNFHHAHDAYLNVIVGGTLSEYYNQFIYSKANYERLKSENRTLNPQKIMKKDTIRIKQKLIWDKASMIKQIKYDLYERYDIHETVRTFHSHEMFKKVTISKAGLSQNIIPTKTTSPRADTSKYGGITSNAYSKYLIVEYSEKNKQKVKLTAIPKIFENNIGNYLQTNLKTTNYKIVHPDIKTNVVVEKNALKFCITGVSGDKFLLQNLRDRFFGYSYLNTIKKIEKFYRQKKKSEPMLIEQNRIVISAAKNDRCEEIALERLEVEALLLYLKTMYQKPIYQYSVIQKIFREININHSEAFKTLDFEKLIELIYQLLSLLKTNERKTADLEYFGGKKKTGKLYFNSILENGTKFIAESPTGYYRKVLFEVK